MPTSTEKRFRLYLFIGLPVAIICWLAILIGVGGYQYESDKFKAMLFTTIVVLLFQFAIADPIKFLIQALCTTCFKRSPKSEPFHYGIPRAKIEHDDIRFFKMRIEWCKAHLHYNWRFKDETLNQHYRETAKDMCLYLRYIILLFLLVTAITSSMLYYHSDGLRILLSEGRLGSQTIDDLETIGEMYDYLEHTVIDVFYGTKNLTLDRPVFTQYEMGKLLGVVRLVQIRLEKKMIGLSTPVYTQKKFLPNWQPYQKLPYADKYWRIYEPWVPQLSVPNDRSLLSSWRAGYLDDYPDKYAYIALLARTRQNTIIILNFLQNHSWLDDYTAAVAIDFTVYNVDAGIFGFCTIMVECTPFGHVILYTRVDSSVLIHNWNHMPTWYLLIILLYLLQLVQFCSRLVLKAWYESATSFFNVWNIMDIIIIVANLFALFFYYLRQQLVHTVMERFESAPKLQFIDFRSAEFVDQLFHVCLAVLVCITTVRLWKVLLFARVFRLIVRTLQLGAVDIIWALLNIMVFLIGFTISSFIINGTAKTLSHTPISFVHILSFSLGYSERVNPLEKTQEQTSAIGLIIYAIVMFCVTLVLVNMLVTLVCIHFSEAKEEERQREKPNITFWQFLTVEYSFLWKCMQHSCAKVKIKMRQIFNKRLKRSFIEIENKFRVPRTRKSEDNSERMAERHSNRLRRTRIITDILLTQTEILNRRLKELEIDFESDNEDIDEEKKTNSDK